MVYSKRKQRTGIGQLSLVEHALCPLDPTRSLQRHLAHECEYRYTDEGGHRRTARVRVTCPLGLSAQDEFYLWGLLALTFSQPEPDVEFHATPHYCLRQLGVIDQYARRGGRQYRQFAAAIERLSVVRYQNHAFYDPVRGEHRRVSFGLFSYSLPLCRESSRAWRIVWDPLLFELISAVGGHLRFDLEMYRGLDPATRRLFLLLSKVFRRRATTPAFDLQYLGVQVLGFAPTMATRDLKAKVARCIKKLVEREIVSQVTPNEAFQHKGNGALSVRLERGPHYLQQRRDNRLSSTVESPLVEPLRAIGVEEGAIVKVLRQYSVRLIQQWVDITLAAEERFGPKFFKRSPAAFFIDNLRHAAAGTRTPPDWWQELHLAERRAHGGRSKPRSRNGSGAGVETKASGSPAEVLTEAMRTHFEVAGQPAEVARRNAERFTLEYQRASGSAEKSQIELLVHLFG